MEGLRLVQMSLKLFVQEFDQCQPMSLVEIICRNYSKCHLWPHCPQHIIVELNLCSDEDTKLLLQLLKYAVGNKA